MINFQKSHRTKSVLAGTLLSALIATCGGLLATPAAAQSTPPAPPVTLFGALTNFDVLNDTGQVTYGFEIELDGLQPQDAYYFYTYNRYGQPKVVPFANGVYVRYMSTWDPATQQFSLGTPIARNFNATTGINAWAYCPAAANTLGS